MSIASKINTLQTITDNIKTKLRSWGILSTPSGTDTYGLTECYDALNSVSGTKTITSTSRFDVLGSKNRYAQVADSNLVPENIVNGVRILGVRGTYNGSSTAPDYTSVEIPYGSAASIDGVYRPQDYGHDYFSQVTLSELPASATTKTLKSENIKRGVTILGVQGSYDFASMDTAHSGVFNSENQHSSSPTDWIHITNGGLTIFFPMRKNVIGGNDYNLQQGDLSISDIQFIEVECNRWEISANTQSYKIVGFKYIRDVYDGIGTNYKLIFKVLHDNKINMVWSEKAFISFTTRTTAAYGSLLNLVINTRSLSDTTPTWHHINAHNERVDTAYSTSDQNFTDDIIFDENCWYHVEVKYSKSSGSRH